MLPGEYDPWVLEDEKSSREVSSFESFRYYALSPTTQEVIYYIDRSSMTQPEMRAHGPGNRTIWIDLPVTLDPIFWMGLNTLAHQLARKGIFKPG